jgi:hypothetical protein
MWFGVQSRTAHAHRLNDVGRRPLAVSGTVAVEVDSDGVHEEWDAYPGTGTITLEDIVLEADGAEPVRVESLSWSAAVGWLPG